MLLPEAVADFIFDCHIEQYIDDAACAKPIMNVGQSHFADALPAICRADKELRDVALTSPLGHVDMFSDIEGESVADGLAVIENQEGEHGFFAEVLEHEFSEPLR